MDKISDRAIDALILAGNRRSYVPVGARNKALIHLHGKRLVEYVAGAMDDCALIRSITVIGPVKRLEFLREIRFKKPLSIIEQRESIVRNVLHAYDHIRPEHDAPILVSTADIPLLTPGELELFILNSGHEGFDCVMGLTSERALEPFYPHGRKRGMRMSYLYFQQFTARINNLIIVNPSVVQHPEYVGVLYSLRYQKRIWNFLRMARELFRKDVPTVALLKWALVLELALQFDRFGRYSMAHRIGQGIDVHTVEDVLSRTLRIRFKAFCMESGGSALDVDNKRDLETMRLRFDQWQEIVAGGAGD